LIPPDGSPGIIRFENFGHIRRYVFSEISGYTLATSATGTFSPSATVADGVDQRFRIGAFIATEEEFIQLFGSKRCTDEKEWIEAHAITEANIHNTIFMYGLK